MSVVNEYMTGYYAGQFDASVDIQNFVNELIDTIEEFDKFSEDTGADMSAQIRTLMYVIDRLKQIVKELEG